MLTACTHCFVLLSVSISHCCTYGSKKPDKSKSASPLKSKESAWAYLHTHEILTRDRMPCTFLAQSWIVGKVRKCLVWEYPASDHFLNLQRDVYSMRPSLVDITARRSPHRERLCQAVCYRSIQHLSTRCAINLHLP